jgi:hypothetical protein
MKTEFGRYFVSLREYLSTPIYENGNIVSCYGMAGNDEYQDNFPIISTAGEILSIFFITTDHKIQIKCFNDRLINLGYKASFIVEYTKKIW